MSVFTLYPFPTDRSLLQVKIDGRVERSDDILSIEYHLQGDLDSIVILPPSDSPTRTFALWEHTCFEFFIGSPGEPNYWEFNLSPSGDWNVFRLDNYRQGLRVESAFTELPFQIDRQLDTLSLSGSWDLTKIIPAERELEIAITTVVKFVGEASPRENRDEISYWALAHKGTEPNFHLRDSFIIKI
ncbi:DOMON-like domain-containing protein [Chamaesiphon polymorphus]|uniref:DOMON-like domain-containing protein n=1 Tax=Chamaesiphon polymorphus CCALA 037 TaxID=2107692 RepID=A0A2T1GDT8_9CYAN|nr:DOMON-like domain-containing protein [Chamaesiphon polymorphus]PSB55692.1 hypothetical protein C7B77_14235 [Chamaesiphon polymorphus CCALA 037]